MCFDATAGGGAAELAGWPTVKRFEYERDYLASSEALHAWLSKLLLAFDCVLVAPSVASLCQVAGLFEVVGIVQVEAKEVAPFCGAFAEPSDGLEPSTPPYHERGEGVDSCGFARDVAGWQGSRVSAFRRNLHRRATLVRPARVRRRPEREQARKQRRVYRRVCIE